jgi:hypothetical protein
MGSALPGSCAGPAGAGCRRGGPSGGRSCRRHLPTKCRARSDAQTSRRRRRGGTVGHTGCRRPSHRCCLHKPRATQKGGSCVGGSRWLTGLQRRYLCSSRHRSTRLLRPLGRSVRSTRHSRRSFACSWCRVWLRRLGCLALFPRLAGRASRQVLAGWRRGAAATLRTSRRACTPTSLAAGLARLRRCFFRGRPGLGAVSHVSRVRVGAREPCSPALRGPGPLSFPRLLDCHLALQ